MVRFIIGLLCSREKSRVQSVVNHTIFGKQKRQNNSKTAGSRYFSARVVNTSGVLSARIPGYQQESAILFLRTIGMFLAYIPVIFAVYLKDIDNLGALRSVAIISLFYYFIRPSFP